MKKLLFLVLTFLTVSIYSAVEDPIDVTEVPQPSINKIKISRLEFFPLEKEAVIILSYGYVLDGKFIEIKFTRHELRKTQYNQLVNLLGITATNIPTIINNLKE
jgi:hypothetical protein